jgi:hypothetical protein
MNGSLVLGLSFTVRVAEGPTSAVLPQISKIRLVVGYEGIKSVCDDPPSLIYTSIWKSG